MRGDPFALYIHVPFCAHKCPYCDFNTYATRDIPESDYTRALICDLEMYAMDPRLEGRHVSSVFFGGGTPSLFAPAAIGNIINQVDRRFGIVSGAEITLEANPSMPSLERYRGYREAGISRISFGVQSFNPNYLTLLGRDHSPEDGCRAVKMCVDAGIANVSVDIIFGVAGQTPAELRHDVEVAASLPITHLSTYALTIEPGTPFFQRQQRGLLATPSEDTVASMLAELPAYLSSLGFARYEISNYTRGEFESAHNQAYWTGRDYLGIGAGAHSYIASYNGERLTGGVRWSALALPAAYMKHSGTRATVSWREQLSGNALRFEFFYLGLRRMAGVSLAEFEQQFGTSARSVYGDILSELKTDGFIFDDGITVALTPKGIAVADSVYEKFIL